MTRIDRRALCGLALALALAAPLAGRAETAPAPPSATVDPAYEGQKAAWDALSEADRRAIQDAMVWSGHYNGVVDGVFGKRTRDAVLAYQASVKATANGLVDAGQAAAMAGAAQKARAAVRFQMFTDDKTGVKIGAPLKILDKRGAGEAGGVRFAKADGSVTLDLSAAAGPDARLGALFAALIADAPGRKIALKVSRPDFFVVSGEDGGRKFYARFARAPAGAADPSAIRGFRFAYPAAQAAELDRVAVAVADSFEPFPAPAAPAAAAASAAAAPAAAPPPPAPSRPALAATGLLVAPGKALSAIGSADCPNPTIDGKAAQFLREDRDAGLSLLGVEADPGASVGAPRLGTAGPDLVALSFADDAGGRAVLGVATATPLGAGAATLLVSLAPRSSGAPVFDRMGGLVAMIARAPDDPRLVAGVAPVAPHGAIDAARIGRFLALPVGEVARIAAGTPPLGAGAIAAAERPFVVAIACRR